MKTAAILIGVIFGGFFLFLFVGEGLDGLRSGHGLVPQVSIPDALALITGPFTLVLATLVGLKFERFAGYWLLAGGVTTVVLLATRHILPMVLAASFFIVLPMWVAGGLWLKHAGSGPPQ